MDEPDDGGGENSIVRRGMVALVPTQVRAHVRERRNYVLESPLPADECLRRIRRRVTRIALPFVPTSDFLGEVTATGFEFRYVGGEVRDGARADIVATGRVVDRQGGARIELVCRTNPVMVPITTVGLAMCLGVGGAALAYTVTVLAGSGHALFPNVLGLLFFVGAWYCAGWLLRDNRALDRHVVGMLVEAVDAVVVSSREIPEFPTAHNQDPT